MPSFFYDLHMHSCLSPCADDDMTPNNICMMAKLKGLDIIAVTDHNSAKNLPAVKAVADQVGVMLLPGIEITTREEVHMLAYFESVEKAQEMGLFVRDHLLPMKNKPDFFGHQLVMNEDDEVIEEEDALFIGATTLPMDELAQKARELGGVPVPAHINRGSNGLLINQGFVPPWLNFATLEVTAHMPCDENATKGCLQIHDSDAHNLGDMHEQEFAIELESLTPACLLEKLRTGGQK